MAAADDAVVAEINSTVVAGIFTFAARMFVRVSRRIGIEDAGTLVEAGVVPTAVFCNGTRVVVDLRMGGGRRTKVGVVVIVAGRELRPGVLAGIFEVAGVGVADLGLRGLPADL